MNRDLKHGRHNYSYIDVLERVADGVHVDVVARKTHERPPDKRRSDSSKSRSEEHAAKRRPSRR